MELLTNIAQWTLYMVINFQCDTTNRTHEYDCWLLGLVEIHRELMIAAAR